MRDKGSGVFATTKGNPTSKPFRFQGNVELGPQRRDAPIEGDPKSAASQGFGGSCVTWMGRKGCEAAARARARHRTERGTGGGNRGSGGARLAVPAAEEGKREEAVGGRKGMTGGPGLLAGERGEGVRGWPAGPRPRKGEGGAGEIWA